MTCCVHYKIYNGENILKSLSKDHHARLLEAKNARINLGGDNLHPDQSGAFPQEFEVGLVFHQSCYKNFTKAISVWKRKNEDVDDEPGGPSSKSQRLHRSGEHSKILFPAHCMICKSANGLKVKGKTRKEQPKVLRELNAEYSIREAAKLKNDQAMLTAIMPETLSLRCAEFKVHEKCYKSYTLICSKQRGRNQQSSSECTTDASDDREGAADGCDEDDLLDPYKKGDPEKLFTYIREHIILIGQAVSMKALTSVYGFDGLQRKDRYYVKKLIEGEFKDDILILNDPCGKNPQIVVRSKAYEDGELLHESSKNSILKHAAQFLRDDIDQFIAREKNESKTWPPTVESLSATRSRYPDCLKNFFTALLKYKTKSAGDTVLLAVDSMIDDVIHSISNGDIYTVKHILMGCGMHSISGSRQDIDIMHKMNNCCSYDLVRAIETAQAELAIELSSRQFPLPLAPKDDFCYVLLRIWWDNFDVIKENKEGSLHTCHGVAYTDESDGTIERDTSIQLTKSSRRSLVKTLQKLPEVNIIPHKLPELLKNATEHNYDGTYASFLPILWKTQRQLCSSNQSVSYRYVGWISTIFKSSEKQRTRLTFLPPINSPITQYNSVVECIHQSQKLAESCNMKYVHITADAGAAMKFYQVIWNNPLKMKNVIIHLGDFQYYWNTRT